MTDEEKNGLIPDSETFGYKWQQKMMQKSKLQLVTYIKNLCQKILFTTSWISINDNDKPRDYENVMYFDSRDESMHVGYFVTSQTPIPNYITHFMKLPTKPKGTKQ
jgi:hypothetical protein